ncbi:diphthamide biosynthesis protein 2 [Halteromyces radiatus]|uniref:diphthamide biosynthesis protein 2 n=1 Tax=Halteromyces radiatus TaxID=101107 RepID=UPI0022201A71|nr:diphthamide biosynthesis protein 2 [Halteromyces radiatus]KAI8086195.1 diphthamide biosynthesis protein 2 [Halteromyces radiatus]
MAAPAQGPTAFSNDGQDIMEREVTESIRHDDDATLLSLYEIERTVAYIHQHGYQRVALQFPDEMLADATAVARLLKTYANMEDKSSVAFFILADTSYGSCCVDEVAAQHIDAQVIIHYGHSCLSPTSHLPVLYVFGQQPVDINDCIEKFQELIPDRSQPVIIMCNVEYAHATEKLTKQLELEYQHIIASFIQQEESIVDGHLDKKTSKCHEKETDLEKVGSCGGRCGGDCGGTTSVTATNHIEQAAEKRKGGRTYILPDDISLEQCVIFFIGHEGLTLTNIMMVHHQCQVYTYDPSSKYGRKETVSVNKMLMKRYFMVQKAKDANTIGIVVGTLGVASYMNIIEHLKKVITLSGRKWYMFVMGKLNVAKMANFMEIDCYVLVACPENSLIDSKDFYRPIVTPFELEIALVKSKEWTGDYVLDFSKLLPHLRTDGFQYDEEMDEGSSDEEGHFSLITGQYVSGPFQKVKAKDDPSTETLTSNLTGLTLRNQETSIAHLMNSTAGEYLRNRSYRGLDPKMGQDEAGDVKEGRSGIARGYTREREAINDEI